MNIPFTPSTRSPDDAIEIYDEAFRPLRLFSAKVEQLGTGFEWTEGPRRTG